MLSRNSTKIKIGSYELLCPIDDVSGILVEKVFELPDGFFTLDDIELEVDELGRTKFSLLLQSSLSLPITDVP